MAIERTKLNEDGSATVRLRNVRLSFPALFEPRKFNDNDPNSKPTFQATFLMAKAGDPERNAELMTKAIAHVVKIGLKGKHPGKAKVCLQSGEEKGERGVDGYDADMLFTSSNARKQPTVVDRDLTQLTASDGKPYAGCYVNATIRLWAQDNKYGKRVNAQLRAVQFFADGEPFGEGGANAEEEFESADDMGADGSSADDEESL